MPVTSPTPLLQSLQGLAQRLHQASQSHDWAALAAADAALARLLQGLQLRGLDANERSALQQLRALHGQVRADCARELDTLRTTLDQMQQRRAGWHAYAESQDWTPETL